MLENLKENDVIALSQAGDDQAIDFILKKYRPMVIKQTRKFYLAGGDEEDLLQEGMIGLFKAARDYKVGCDTDFAVFAHVCITRELISAVRADNRQKNKILNGSVSIDKTDKTFSGYDKLKLVDILEGGYPDPETLYIQNEQVSDLLEKFESMLSKYENKVLKLYLDGESYKEIGEKLSKNTKSIENAVSRIRAKLTECTR